MMGTLSNLLLNYMNTSWIIESNQYKIERGAWSYKHNLKFFYLYLGFPIARNLKLPISIIHQLQGRKNFQLQWQRYQKKRFITSKGKGQITKFSKSFFKNLELT